MDRSLGAILKREMLCKRREEEAAKLSARVGWCALINSGEAAKLSARVGRDIGQFTKKTADSMLQLGWLAAVWLANGYLTAWQACGFVFCAGNCLVAIYIACRAGMWLSCKWAGCFFG